MEQTKMNVRLSVMQLFLLVLSLVAFSSTMRFLPWFVEDAFGWSGILITAPLLFCIGLVMTYLQKNKRYTITAMRKIVPFSASIFSLCIVLLNITDFSIITALVFNFGMLIITIVFLLQDLSKLNKN
ncbi:hypothetical protein [Bacillus rhizoplanae]|uniref:hypothetical protein n=1 Tax=Bacillus rhizoplanae TaxID=2880966 RepID=UPI003D1DDBDE